MRYRVGVLIIIALITLLSACKLDRPPKGFEAVVPTHWDTSRTGCPDLIGSYLLGAAARENSVLSTWLGAHSEGMTFWVFESLVGSNAYNLGVQAETNNFLLAAQKLRQANAADYYAWRKLIAKARTDKKDSDRDLLKEIAALGPVFRLRAQLHGYGCEAGWIKILEVETRVVEGENSFVRQEDLWIGKDALGNLLLHTMSYRQEPGWTFWAAGGAGMRLIKTGEQWHKMLKAPDDLQPREWLDSELPNITPPQNSADCRTNVNALVDFNQEFISHLPAAVTLEKFQPSPPVPTQLCNQSKIIIAIAAPTRADAGIFETQLRHMHAVVGVELKETRMSERKWHLVFEVTVNLAR